MRQAKQGGLALLRSVFCCNFLTMFDKPAPNSSQLRSCSRVVEVYHAAVVLQRNELAEGSPFRRVIKQSGRRWLRGVAQSLLARETDAALTVTSNVREPAS